MWSSPASRKEIYTNQSCEEFKQSKIIQLRRLAHTQLENALDLFLAWSSQSLRAWPRILFCQKKIHAAQLITYLGHLRALHDETRLDLSALFIAKATLTWIKPWMQIINMQLFHKINSSAPSKSFPKRLSSLPRLIVSWKRTVVNRIPSRSPASKRQNTKSKVIIEIKLYVYTIFERIQLSLHDGNRSDLREPRTLVLILHITHTTCRERLNTKYLFISFPVYLSVWTTIPARLIAAYMLIYQSGPRASCSLAWADQ